NGQTLASASCFTYTSDNQPIVTAILPASGTKIGGTRVTIVGSGFTAPVQVFFGGTLEAQVVSVSPTQIIAITPPANAQGPDTTFPQNVDVTVKEVNCSGTTCTSSPVTYTYTVGMSIFGFTPDHGDASTTVTITGQGFVAPLLVTFGGVQGTVLSVTGTQILAKPPAGCPSSGGTIAVTLLSDGETAAAPGTFTINVPTVTSFAPTSGPGGTATPVTVIGTDFFPTGSPSRVSVTGAGGAIGTVSVSEVNGQQTLSFTVNPDVCSPTVTVTIVNEATGCTVERTFTNSTFNAAAPTASPSATPGPANDQASFSAATSTTGTPNFTYAWTFTNPDGTAATPATSAAQNPGAVTFNCGSNGPACTGLASGTLVVTDACSKTATQGVTVAPQ
ncbi:MAG TPA: IPT/TIG domain-containing protein, partial [Thermoanaerobaculia bacterium]|nr:IPT/TIG domain-containing protein [Thermoanaerobaculia bacterium]